MRRVVVVTLHSLTTLALAVLAYSAGFHAPTAGIAGVINSVLDLIFVASIAAAVLTSSTAYLVGRGRRLGDVLNIVLGVLFVVAGLALLTMTATGWFAIAVGTVCLVSGVPLLRTTTSREPDDVDPNHRFAPGPPEEK